ncbi:uncharacterized protein LOC134232886 [Saccostrea cucullata]|uniref:uncharacterized protein LOC134232886 n=1 Tax=Saccostrea cuccullata TaxID=36930 RepID=UPI002ED2D7EE
MTTVAKAQHKMYLSLCIIVSVFLPIIYSGSLYKMPTACLATCPTIKTVKSCPVNKEEKEERERLLACEKINQNCTEAAKFKYHCLMNERGELVELCAPMVCILGRVCAEFNLGGGLIQELHTKNCKNCPFLYDSSTLFEYQECFPHSTYTKRKYSKEKTHKSNPGGTYSILLVFGILGLVFLCSFSVFLYCSKASNMKPSKDSSIEEALCD